MKKTHLFYLIIVVILLLISAPFFHLLKTKIAENKTESTIKKGYANDESHLNLTKIDSTVTVSSDSLY